MGDAGSAITYFDESVEFLSQVPPDDMEIIHTLSVSLNKIGDLKYYDGDLQASRTYYFRCLEVRRNAMLNHHDNASLKAANGPKYAPEIIFEIVGVMLSTEDAIEIEVSEVLYGLMKQSQAPSKQETLDVAVSLAKVADVDRGLGNEEGAISGFHEGVNMLQSLKIDTSQEALEQRRLSVLEFLNSQITENQPDQTS